MKKTLFINAIICALILCAGGAFSQSKNTPAVKMPAEYSKQIDTLQEQSKKLETDYAQVIGLYKDYVSKRDQIQAQAAVLITRAALAAHLTIEQLDNSDLVKDEKGNYEWREKVKAAPAAAQPPK